MAKVPHYVGYPSVQPDFVPTPWQTIPSANDPNAFGAGIGAAITKVGGAFEQMAQTAARAEAIDQAEKDRLERFKATIAVNKFNESETERLTRAARDAPSEAVDFSKNFMRDHDKNRQQVLSTISPRLRGEVEVKLLGNRGHYSKDSLNNEFAKRDGHYSSEIKKQTASTTSATLNDPDSVDARVAGITEVITESGLPAEEKAKLIESETPMVVDAAITGLQQQGRIEEARALRDRYYGTVPRAPGTKGPTVPEGTEAKPAIMPNATRSLGWEAKFNSHYKDVQTAEEKRSKAENDQLKDNYSKEVVARMQPETSRPPGTPALDHKFMTEARPYISDERYNAGLLSLRPESEKVTEDNSETVIGLRIALDKVPHEQYLAMLNEAKRGGKLKDETYNTLDNKSREIWTGPEKPYKRVRGYVNNKMQPALFNNPSANQMARNGQSDALADFDAWADDNPGASLSEYMKAGNEIIDRNAMVPLRTIRGSLARTRHLSGIPHEGITLEQVEDAGRKLLEDIDSGRVGPNEGSVESLKIADWLTLIASEEAAKTGGSGGRSGRRP